jgi:CRP-like cAMP-binding protein
MSLQDLLDNQDFMQQVGWNKEQYQTNDIIIDIGTPGYDVYLVLSGQLHVRTTLESNISHALDSACGLAKLDQGDVFGELSIFDSEPRSAQVIAASDCELAKINGQKLIQFMNANPKLGYSIIHGFFMNLSAELRQSNLRTQTILQLYLAEQGKINN